MRGSSGEVMWMGWVTGVVVRGGGGCHRGAGGAVHYGMGTTQVGERARRRRGPVLLGIAAGVLLGTGIGVLGALAVGGCEEQSAPAPKSGNTIGLSETPNSLYGRSAKRGKDVAA